MNRPTRRSLLSLLFLVLTLDARGGGPPSSTLPISLGISPDELPALLETIEQSTPIDADSVPLVGTFYSAQNLGWPPLPSDIIGVPAWDLGNGVWLLNDVGYDYSSTQSLGQMRAMNDSSGFYLADTTCTFPTNGLWLQITALSNSLVNLNLNNAADSVYEIFSVTDLTATNWNIEDEL